MRIPILLFCVVVVGCGKKPPPSCDAVADHVQTLYGGAGDAYATELRTAFAVRCGEDLWSAEMRSCVAGTKSLVEPQSCKQKLTPIQVKNLDEAVATIDDRAAKSTIPGACTRYEKLLASVLTCDVLPRSARDQLKTNFDAFKATWPSVPDKRTLEPICGSAIKTVKGVTTTCPGAASW